MTCKTTKVAEISLRLGILSRKYRSVNEFARVCGIGAGGLSKAIREQSGIRVNTAAEIAEKTGCSPEWLLLGIGEPFPTESNGECAGACTGTEGMIVPADSKEATALRAKIMDLESRLAAETGRADYLHKRLTQEMGHKPNPPCTSAQS